MVEIFGKDVVRVIVLGAETPLGQEVVGDLLLRGHQPTAVFEDISGGADHFQHPVGVARGDITDPHGLASALAGTQAVVDVLSVTPNQQATVRAHATTRHLVKTMAAHRVHRYVGLAPHYLYPAPDDTPRIARARQEIRQTLHPRGTAHTRDRFRMVTTSQLNWTIVRTQP